MSFALPETVRLPGGGAVTGFAIAAAITAVAIAVNRTLLPLLSPLVTAMLLGIAVRYTIGIRAEWRPGIAVAMKKMLRLAIVLLGAQVTLAEILAIGPATLASVIGGLAATMAVTLWLGRVLGVDRALTALIATGTSVCGASAILAANTVAGGKDEDVAYSLAVITLFGTLCLLLFPLLIGPLGLTPIAFGIWSGAAIHEVAQVVGTAFQAGDTAGQVGTVAKLARVLCLAPVVLFLGWWMMRSRKNDAGARDTADGTAKGAGVVPTPWFVFGFLALVVLGSAGGIPAMARTASSQITPVLLTLSLAAMGMEADLRRIKARGLRPLALGALSTLFIAGFTLALVLLTVPG